MVKLMSLVALALFGLCHQASGACDIPSFGASTTVCVTDLAGGNDCSALHAYLACLEKAFTDAGCDESTDTIQWEIVGTAITTVSQGGCGCGSLVPQITVIVGCMLLYFTQRK